jgi:hypothetical protein
MPALHLSPYMIPGTTIKKSENGIIWFSRILRWSLGSLFIWAGIHYFRDGAWPALFFGSVLFITGWLRPRRCIDDQCDLNA